MSDVAPAFTKTTRSVGNGSTAWFPLWNGNIGTQQVLRFLWDKQNSPRPVVERWVIKAPFDGGIINSENDTSEPALVNLPCAEMYGDKCPFTEGIRELWSGSEAQRKEASRRYRKKTYIMNGFVCSTTIKENKTPENPIRLFAFNQNLFENAIQRGMLDAELEFAPWDPQEGRDFVVRKVQQGSWASYTPSAYAFKARPLSDTEIAAIEKYGVNDLQALIDPQPTSEVMEQIAEMFVDSMAGLPFDAAKFPAFKAYAAPPYAAALATGGPSEEAKSATQDTIALLRRKVMAGGLTGK